MSLIIVLQQYLPLVKDFILIIAAIIGAYVALTGLYTWSRQLKGSVEYDLTRRLLKSTYKLRDAVRNVRNPVMTSNEMPEPPNENAENMRYDQIRHYGIEKAYQARWDQVYEIRRELQADMLEAEAIWGTAVYDVFKGLFDLQTELFINVRNYIGVSNPDLNQAIRDALHKAMNQKRDVLYELSADEPDEFTKDVSAAIAEVETYLKPHLKK